MGLDRKCQSNVLIGVSEENKMCNSSVTQLSIQLKLCRRKNLSMQKYDLVLESSIVFGGVCGNVYYEKLYGQYINVS